ncbi:MAG: class I SAM-dependent methyltransferase [Rhodobacteraceae bacterium]|jgi:cyclopropane fatty-acyl-phospholipid synthase-like methyltransferase|nr:class I SAM-dependent methyltransferase [Paracoccaceae bacterium]
MWDERFARDGYLFGTEPADFLRREAGRLAPASRLLCIADGEGRNSVWLAGQGHSVVAMDGSAVGMAKARRLAADRGVTVETHVADIADWDWTARPYDAVVAIFIQFAPPPLRDRIFAGLQAALRPGGLILLHGYTPEQIALGTGGPRAVEQLYTPALLRAAFAGMEILRLAAYRAEVDEGEGHSGPSALIDLVARKPGQGS